MNEFHFVCNQNELIEKKCKKIEVDGTDVVLIRKDGEIHALDNYCTHHHVSVMHNGDIEGDFLLCPNHFWKFDIKTGKKNGNVRGLTKHEVKVEGDKVFVKIAKQELNW